MTLYLIPAWITSGLMVSRSSARMARAYIGSHRARRAASLRRGSSPPIAATSAGLGGRQCGPIPSSNRRIDAGQARLAGAGPGVTTASAAMTAALSSRGIDPWPHVPWTVIR